MQTSVLQFFNIPISSKDISLIISIPLNGFISLIPEPNNTKIKKISFLILPTDETVYINFCSLRFRLRNRDLSLSAGLAGNILNPISGVFDGSLPKDTHVDIMLNSNENSIEFKTPILAGGIQLQTIRLILNSITSVATTVSLFININYEQ